MAEIKEFDWEEAHSRNPGNAAFLKEIWDKPITRDEYIDLWLALPQHKGRTTRSRPGAQYDYLQRTFGFFKGAK